MNEHTSAPAVWNLTAAWDNSAANAFGGNVAWNTETRTNGSCRPLLHTGWMRALEWGLWKSQKGATLGGRCWHILFSVFFFFLSWMEMLSWAPTLAQLVASVRTEWKQDQQRSNVEQQMCLVPRRIHALCRGSKKGIYSCKNKQLNSMFRQSLWKK